MTALTQFRRECSALIDIIRVLDRLPTDDARMRVLRAATTLAEDAP